MSSSKPHSTVATRMSGIREDWLALTREEILEPGLAIVDPHHHLWDFPSHRYLLQDLLALFCQLAVFFVHFVYLDVDVVTAVLVEFLARRRLGRETCEFESYDNVGYLESRVVHVV